MATVVGIIVKLVLFSLAMITLPIASYFLSEHYFFEDQPIYSVVTSVIVVHIVLLAYVVVAYNEDQEWEKIVQKEKAQKGKDEQKVEQKEEQKEKPKEKSKEKSKKTN